MREQPLLHHCPSGSAVRTSVRPSCSCSGSSSPSHAIAQYDANRARDVGNRIVLAPAIRGAVGDPHEQAGSTVRNTVLRLTWLRLYMLVRRKSCVSSKIETWQTFSHQRPVYLLALFVANLLPSMGGEKPYPIGGMGTVSSAQSIELSGLLESW